ncbi:MAG: hypothetical protein R3F31_11560 [Verrucomicrobiales bacterium]
MFHHADDVVSIHRRWAGARYGSRQRIVVVRGGGDIARFAQGVERVEDIAVRRADLSDGVVEPVLEDARGHAESLRDGGSGGDEILGSRVFESIAR